MTQADQDGPLTDPQDAIAATDMPDGWSIELRLSSYQVVDGKTERTYWNQAYEGSMSEAEGRSAFERMLAAMEPSTNGTLSSALPRPAQDEP